MADTDTPTVHVLGRSASPRRLAEDVATALDALGIEPGDAFEIRPCDSLKLTNIVRFASNRDWPNEHD